MAHLSLSLLGPFQATLDGEPVLPSAARLQALLSYLAVEADHAHSRQALAGLLWPERPDQDALVALRYALSNLRRALLEREAQRPFLLVSHHTVQFDSTSDHWLDVDEFRTSVAAEETRPGRLDTAAGLYRGEFLEGLTLGDSPTFEEWLLLKREHFHRQALTALQRLAALHELRGEYGPAAVHTRQILALEPWDEAAHRRLMRLLAVGGQRNGALAQYETCRHVLGQELGVEPEDDTTSLYERIRRGEVVPVAVLQPASSPSARDASPASAPFVGREAELARLDAFLALALAGQGRVAFVSGEAGGGKTMLVHQFARRAMARHGELVVAGGTCNAHAGHGDPYLPFREIVQVLTGDMEVRGASGNLSAEHARRLWAVFADAVQALVSEGPDLIGRFLPGEALAVRAEAFVPGSAAWRTRLAELVRREEARPDLAIAPQADLCEQVTRVLQTLARRHPLILVLDDLQWADGGTLSLLFHLGRRLAGHRLLVVGAYRPAELAPGPNGERHPLEPILNELQRDLGDIQIDLHRADGRGFVDAFLDTEPNRLGDAFRETLFRHTAGNPLFTVELLRGLQERGDLVRDEGGRWVEGPSLDWGRLPARVEAVIAECFARLPAAWRQMLAVASVEGEVFTTEVVAQVQDADDDEIVERLSGPLSKQHRLVVSHNLRRVDGRRLSCYRFRHILFQNYLYRCLDGVERARLHEAVGTELEALYGEQVAEISGQLARHFEAAGQVAKAVEYLHLAGRRAVRLSANDAAIDCFSRGLELLETLPETPKRDAEELALRLALYAPLHAIESYTSPRLGRSSARMQALCQRMGYTPQLIPVCMTLAVHYGLQAQFSTGLAHAEKALPLAERQGQAGFVTWAHQTSGWHELFLGNLAAARDHLAAPPVADEKQLQAMLAVVGTDQRVVYYAWNAPVLWLLGYPDQARQCTQSALRVAQTLEHAHSQAFALLVGGIHVAQMRRALGDMQAWVEALERLTTKKITYMQGLTRFYRGWLSAWENPAQAQIAVEQMWQGLAAWLATGMKALETLYLTGLADACLVAGQWVEARRALDAGLAAVEATGAVFMAAELHRLQGELFLVEGKDAEAEACFRRAIQVAQRQEARSLELRATVSLARLLGQQGHLEEARRNLAEIYGWFAEGFDSPDLQEASALIRDLAPERGS